MRSNEVYPGNTNWQGDFEETSLGHISSIIKTMAMVKAQSQRANDCFGDKNKTDDYAPVLNGVATDCDAVTRGTSVDTSRGVVAAVAFRGLATASD